MKGQLPWNTGKKCGHPWNYGHRGGHLSKDHKEKIGLSQIGRKGWNAGLTKETDIRVYKTSKKIAANGKHFFKAGKKHPSWKGGTSPERIRIMQNKEYREWRLGVYRKDNYVCQICNETGKKLHAHHIKSYAEYPNLRTDINNGMTLCAECHHNIHSKRGD